MERRHRHLAAHGRLARLIAGGLVPVAIGLGMACGSPPPEEAPRTPIPTVTDATPAEDVLRLSFMRQIESVPGVRDIDYAEDGLRFVGPDASGDEASWRVVIDDVQIETQPDGSPYRGNISSRWHRDDAEIAALPNAPTLPEPYLEWGLSQTCFALWDVVDQRWSWV